MHAGLWKLWAIGAFKFFLRKNPMAALGHVNFYFTFNLLLFYFCFIFVLILFYFDFLC